MEIMADDSNGDFSLPFKSRQENEDGASRFIIKLKNGCITL